MYNFDMYNVLFMYNLDMYNVQRIYYLDAAKLLIWGKTSYKVYEGMGKWGNFPQSPKPPLCCVGDFGIQIV